MGHIGLVNHAVRRTGSVISVLAVIGVIAFLGWSVWKTFNPDPTTTQRAEIIQNITYQEKKSLIEFKLWFLKVRLW